MKYYALIVDDEEPARIKVAQFLQQLKQPFDYTFAKNGEEAIKMIQEQTFDLLFLDIQMPQMTGLEMLQHIDLVHSPAIIFSTAYDQYALQAFDVHAVDYLLKPYDFERFEIAVQKVLEKLTAKKYSNQAMTELLQAWQGPEKKLEVLWVHQGSKLLPIEVNSIEYLESDGNYVLIHSQGRKHMLRQSLSELHEKLNHPQFVRVHRSYVVNQLYISELYPKSHGDLFAILKSGAKITVSRRYKEQLIK